MNYYQPRQVDPQAEREDAGKWRYTNHNKRIGTYPIGYCESCPGHDTKEGAYEHQREYELDNARFHEGPSVEDALQRFKCEVPDCETLTTSRADVGPGMSLDVHLCAEHLNREGLAAAWDGPGNVMSS